MQGIFSSRQRTLSLPAMFQSDLNYKALLQRGGEVAQTRRLSLRDAQEPNGMSC